MTLIDHQVTDFLFMTPISYQAIGFSLYDSNRPPDNRFPLYDANRPPDDRLSLYDANILPDNRFSLNDSNRPPDNRFSLYDSNRPPDARFSHCDANRPPDPRFDFKRFSRHSLAVLSRCVNRQAGTGVRRFLSRLVSLGVNTSLPE